MNPTLKPELKWDIISMVNIRDAAESVIVRCVNDEDVGGYRMNLGE